MRAAVKEKREVAKGTLLLEFDLLGEKVHFLPGQYFWVELVDPPYEDDKGSRRHISVVTSPNDHGVLGLCTRVRDTAFKRSLAELEVGDPVEVEEPKGSFVLPEETDRPYVFVAGGIGITVFRCMLLFIHENRLAHNVTLVYSNRDVESTAFYDELVELEREMDNLRIVFSMTTMTEDPSWDGETRRIDADLLRDVLDDDLEAYEFLVAGPPEMAQAVADSLTGAGVPEEQVRADRFSGY